MATLSGKYFINGRERQNMSTTLGKSAGIALLLAAGLLLALYAAGVFTARPASADGHALSQLRLDHGPNHNDPDMDLTPDFDPDNPASHYTATFPFNATTTDQIVQVVARAESGNSSTVTVAASSGGMVEDDEDADADRATVQVVPDTSVTQDLTGALITITSRSNNSGAEEVYTIRLKQAGEITNSTEAGAAVRLRLNANVRAQVGSEITIGLKSFGLPENINKADVTINDGENSGNPSDVTVSGSNVTLLMGKLKSDADNSDAANNLPPDYATNATGTESVSITIASRAGIKNPTKAGTYLVTVDSADSDESGVDARRVATVVRGIKITPTSAGKNAEVTVTGTGFTDGSATIFRDLGTLNQYDPGTDVDLGTAEVTKGSFTFTTSAIGVDSTIQVVDFNGDLASEGKAFTIKASIKVSPTQVSPAEDLTVELVDWGDDEITSIRFGGTISVTSTGSGSSQRAISANTNGAKITVRVPENVRLGSVKVEAISGERGSIGGTSKASASVTVQANVLTITPTTAVPGQEVTIQGSGFGNGKTITELTFGAGDNVYEGTNAPAEPQSDSNGNITITVNVPMDVNAGSREVKVKSEENRIGTASLTVPKPTLTVTPTEGLRGTPVTLTGSGFTANDSLQIKYDNKSGATTNAQVVTSATVNSTGNFTKVFDVPRFATIGDTSKITVSSQLNEDHFEDVTVDHKTPKPVITLSTETAAAGSIISVSGMNFAGFAQVHELMISDRDVKPGGSPATESDGSITMTGVLVPQLDPGNYTVKLTIAGKTVTKFLAVTDAPVSTAPADVFEPLVEAENLVVVWHYDNATGTWTSYSPTVPAELNDLASVSSRTIVWVQVSVATTFQGNDLVAGWNLITLN